MKNRELIEIILGKITESGRISCLQLALRSARYNSGRDIQTGKGNSIETICNLYNKSEVLDHKLFESCVFSGLVTYLIILDQIGILFKRKSTSLINDKCSGVKAALEIFSRYRVDNHIDEKTITAIYDLRNSLAHNFGLATENKSNGHKFSLNFEDNREAVILPKKDWECIFIDKDDETSTEICISSLCEVIEEVVDNVCKAYDKEDLELRIEENEVKARFTILI